MILTPFSFSNIAGKYRIREGRIVTEEAGDWKKLYETGRPASPIAYSFARLLHATEEEVIRFCDAFGLLSCSALDFNTTNNYLFTGKEKDRYGAENEQKPELDTYPLALFYAQARDMHHMLALKAALDARDPASAADAILSLLLTPPVSAKYLHSPTESHRFRYVFSELFGQEADARAAEKAGGNTARRKPEWSVDLTEPAESFAEMLGSYVSFRVDEKAWAENEVFEDLEDPYAPEQMLDEAWPAFADLLAKCAQYGSVLTDPARREVRLETASASAVEKMEEEICKAGQAVFADFMNAGLGRDASIRPEIVMRMGIPSPDLYIPSLLQAMYMELYTSFAGNRLVKRCPVCGIYFDTDPSDGRVKGKCYCSHRCAVNAAKRAMRKRKKEN